MITEIKISRKNQITDESARSRSSNKKALRRILCILSGDTPNIDKQLHIIGVPLKKKST